MKKLIFILLLFSQCLTAQDKYPTPFYFNWNNHTSRMPLTIVNTGQMGANVVNKLYGTSNTPASSDFNQIVNQGKSENLTATNTPQKLGKLGEQIAEFFIPGGIAADAGKAAELAVNGGKVLKGIAKLGAMSATEGVLAGGQTLMQSGDINKEVGTAAAIGALTPPIVSAGGKILKVAGKVGAETLGKMTGTGGETIMQAFDHPNVIKYAREAGKDVSGFQNDVLNETKGALRIIAEKRANVYQSQLDKIKLDDTKLKTIGDELVQKASHLLDEHNIGLNTQTGRLDFNNSTLVEGANVTEKAINDVMAWTDYTASGFDKLKRRLGTYADQLSSRDKRQAQSLVLGLRNTVDQGLKNNVAGYETMTQGYRQASNLIDDINKTFSLGNNKMRETQLKKVMYALKDNNENRKILLDTLSQAGNKDLVVKVAGAQLAKTTPRGLSGHIAPIGLGGLAVLHPANIPAILAYASLTSPRAVGEIVNILGKVDRQMIKLDKFSPEIERSIRELLIKSSNSVPQTSHQ